MTREQRKRLETIEDELEEVKRKLGRIWHFIETSDAVMADASDRIREHRERQERLEYFAEQARAVLAQRRKVLDDVNTIAAYAKDMKDFLKESELTRAQGLHPVLYQGDRRRARRRPAQIHSPYARRQLDTWESRRKGDPSHSCSIYFTRWWAGVDKIKNRGRFSGHSIARHGDRVRQRRLSSPTTSMPSTKLWMSALRSGIVPSRKKSRKFATYRTISSVLGSSTLLCSSWVSASSLAASSCSSRCLRDMMRGDKDLYRQLTGLDGLVELLKTLPHVG